MFNFILGIIFGIIIADIGLEGFARYADQGISVIKSEAKNLINK